MNAPTVGPHLCAATGDIEDQAEQFPAGFFNRHLAGRDAASIEIDQVFPAPRQFAAGCDLDDGRSREPGGVPRPVVNTCKVMPEAS